MFYRTPTSLNPHAPIHITSAELTRLTNALDARRQAGSAMDAAASGFLAVASAISARPNHPYRAVAAMQTTRCCSGQRVVGHCNLNSAAHSAGGATPNT